MGDVPVKRILAAFFCAALLLLAAGCGGQRAQTLRAQLAEEPATLDPQIARGSDAATLISALYEGLCRLDADGKAQPGAAQSWEANAAHTQFTFHLRADAVWNGNVAALTDDGADEGAPTPVTAADFVFAWQRALDPATGSSTCGPLLCIQNAAAIRAGQKQPGELGVSAPDSRTLVVNLARACPDFPEQTASAPCMPCNRDFFDATAGQYGMERAAILGNGPFSMKPYGWTHGERITLLRAEDYRGAQAAVPSALSFTIGAVTVDADMAGAPSAAEASGSSAPVSSGVPQQALGAAEALAGGQLDAAPLPAGSVQEAKDAGLDVAVFTDTTWGLCFNASGKFQSAGLRGAFLQALDRDALMGLLPAGTTPAEDILPPDTRFNGENYRAQAGGGFYMRASAGAAQGYGAQDTQGFKMTLLCTPAAKPLASQMLADWNAAFHAYFSLEAVSEEDLYARVCAGDYDAALYPLTPDAADAGTALSSFLSGQHTGPALLQDSAFDQLLASATTAGQLAAAEKYLCDNAVFYPLYYASHAYATAGGVKGVVRHGFNGGMDFRQAAAAQ